MGLPPTEAARVGRHAYDSAVAALSSEIESVVLDRMTDAGGNLAQVARYRGFLNDALGAFGTVSDLIDMAVAGYEAMTIERRMIMRISAAHGFGYWVFQDRGLQSPRNPPNAFLVMQRDQDSSDARIGHATGNEDFSSDGGLTSYDWNIIWQTGVQNGLRRMEQRMTRMHRSGDLQRALRDRLGPNVNVAAQNQSAMANQYRTLYMIPKLRSPAAAAGGYFLSSLRGAPDLEKDMNLRLYRRFAYNPPVRV